MRAPTASTTEMARGPGRSKGDLTSEDRRIWARVSGSVTPPKTRKAARVTPGAVIPEEPVSVQAAAPVAAKPVTPVVVKPVVAKPVVAKPVVAKSGAKRGRAFSKAVEAAPPVTPASTTHPMAAALAAIKPKLAFAKPASAKPAPAKPASKTTPAKAAVAKPVAPQPTAAKPVVPVAPSRSRPEVLEPRRHRRLSRERDPIEGRIDLHGFGRFEAEDQLRAFLISAQARGQRAVLVITGQGRRGGGVIRASVHEWLQASALRGVVSGFAVSHARHGGDGAIYVTLKRRD